MPKKLVDCVKKVQAKGNSKSSSWAICTASTGLKKEKTNHFKKAK